MGLIEKLWKLTDNLQEYYEKLWKVFKTGRVFGLWDYLSA